ncbi:hypothetical protein SOM12_00450 [Flavobacterium sp. CFBP9031]|jgi:hypothetical protein|uniref:hypothetical protein n=1 Tax=Flavobacterium sp. CFBP9031 TaxID=3096538 RepID=UPI002A6A0E01|nr:hypothetical protein [Flavobacterium sp. CFBP9031]MDY0985872.1 hypothetical protein [Flavobacterium sp. CFBP9031]
MENDLHLVFTYPENFPKEIIDDDIAKIESQNLEIHIEKQGIETYASFEWIVPTFFATYLLKPYFESFLQEAGKDHYQLLKNSCKKMLERGKETQVKLISASKSTKKLSKKYNQSLSVSILAETKTKRLIKLLFDNDLELDDWENAVEELSNYLLDHYQNYPSDQLSDKIKDLSQKPHHTIYVKINPKSKKLEFHDDSTLMMETRNLELS